MHCSVAGLTEEAVCIGRVFAVDPDEGVNGTVTYSSIPDNSSKDGGGGFVVDSVSGLICAPADSFSLRDTQAEYFLWVSNDYLSYLPVNRCIFF